MQNYHRHSSYSNIYIADSAVMNEDYAKRAVEVGHKIISSVEHGWQGYYYQTFELAKKYNLKFVFGAEAYWVKDRTEKDKTNCHIIILAKNENGRRAINEVLSEANETGYYFRPRLDLDLLLSLPSNDVFVTTACIAFWKYDDIEEIVLQLKEHFQSNLMLEIQYHNTPQQIALNKKIKKIAYDNDIQMIVGLDSHYIYPEQSEDRQNLLEANKVFYEDEEGWYMDYPDDNTIMQRFLEQGVFTKDEVQTAMDNTNICLTFDDIVLTDDIKLPTIYPDKTQEERNKLYTKLIASKLKEYIKDFSVEEKKRYITSVQQEVDVYKKTKMVDYPLIDYQIVKRAIEKGGLITDTGRGSGVGYFTNTLCGFSKVDRFKSPIKLYPERFISESRILETRSLPDLDLNCGNPEIFAEAQEEILGKGHAYPMIAFGTLKKKAAFKMYSRAMNMETELANNISKQIGDYEEAYKNADDEDKDMIDIYDYVDKNYHNYLDQSKKYWGIISDKKKAPCAYLLYQGDIRSEVGLIKCKSDTTKKEYITTVIDGSIAEKYKFLKNDLLKVDVVLLINNLYKRIGIKHHTVNELTELVKNDEKVWNIYSSGLTIGINQCEKQSTTKKAMKFKPQNISELAAFIAAIRPAFKSMYSKFETREHFEYGIKAFDNILQTPEFPQSFILYQEQTMNTLNYAGFPLDECYGIIKAIAKKHPEKVKPLKSRFIDGFKARIIADDKVDENTAMEMSNKVWQIISDSCGYGFNSAHAYCMALDSLYCAYLKAHYPYEFYEVLLQHYSDKGNKDKVMLLKQEMREGFKIEEGKYKFGEDNRRFKADQNSHCIYPSLLSIKGLSQKVADELYTIGQMKFDNFYDIWKALKKSSVINKGHIEILAKINYFSDFGNNERILRFIEMTDSLYERTQFSKNSVPLEIAEIIKNHSKETEKQYREFDYDTALYECWDSLSNIKSSLIKTIQYQKEILGYIDYANPKAPENLYYVLEMKVYKDKCKPYVTLYHLKTGTTMKSKVISANEYASIPFRENSILNIWFDDKYKSKLIDGKWVKTNEKEKVMIHWEVLKN